MPYEEGFPAEVEEAPITEAVIAETTPEPVAVATSEEAPETATATAEETATVVEEQPEGVTTAAVAEQPAFDEQAYLRDKFGEDAPASADALKEQLATLKANQLTDEIKGKIAVLSDPEKLAEFAKLSSADYDKPTAREIMFTRFRDEHADMSDAQAHRRFDQQFATKYPTLAAAIANPEEYAADDPALIAEKEDADYDAKADRTALKTKQQEATQAFLQAVSASQPASTAPQATPEQIADAEAIAKWSDETLKDGYSIPLTVGKDEKFNFEVKDSASFKDAFFNTPKLYDQFIYNDKGLLNRENQALAAAFLRDPNAFIASVYNAGKGSTGPNIPVAELANSSQRQAKPTTATASQAGPSNHAPYVNADAWQSSNA